MKQFVLLLLFFSTNTFAQNSHVFSVDNIPAEGVSLDNGWKWHTGDNPDWAKVNFDDSKWESINPALSVPELKQITTDSSLWLRLKFKTDIAKSVALAITQSGASEIFLNGHLIHSFGKIDPQQKKTIAYDPLNDYLIMNLDSAENTLAIRYYFQQDLQYKAFFSAQFPFFSSRFYSNSYSIKQDNKVVTYFWDGFNSGVYAILFIVHFIFFLSYMPTRANLWYSLWALLSSIISYFLLMIELTHSLEAKNNYILYSNIISPLQNILLFYSIYLLLKLKNVRFIIFFATFSFLSLLNFSGNWYFNLLLLVGYVSIVIYMGITAWNQGVQGGIYVVFGMVAFIVFWFSFLLSYTFGWGQLSHDVLFHLATLSLPVSTSILLGLEFRSTNKLLIKNLAEVNKLSIEKQQMLSIQNETLEKLVTERTFALNQSLENLKSAQAQLIQSEKMASLGELTAGIAHEIQNQLNFVNNFSELSKELLDEMKTELDNGNTDDAKEIADDVIQNLEKINHHGKRAGDIVKSMLQHSQTSTGKTEPTNINALADEYLRLAYHGLRAKDKDFNVTIKTDFDSSIGSISIIPQDIGRVLLNLYNNAFYACAEQSRSVVAEKKKQQPEGYEPTVSVSTKKVNGKIEIRVGDNGNGISPKIVDKIFQPFFTTKPTGQGTGLGLSLSYDIVKAHGGEIKVETKEGEGTEFCIVLPS